MVAEESLDKLFGTLDEIRREIAVAPPPDSLEPRHISAILHTLGTMPGEWSAHLREQVRAYELAPHERKNIFRSESEPYVIASLFDVPGAPHPIHFEYAWFDHLRVSDEVAANFKSIASPVWLRRTSAGLCSERVVALFPENWKNKAGKKVELDDEVLYFINRFVERFFRYSLPILEKFTAPETFSTLKRAAVGDGAAERIRDLSVLWMRIHEHCHHLGRLPIPEFLHLKSTRFAGAVEEMRADVLGILEVSRFSGFSAEERSLISEFMLSERLLRYPVECLLRGEAINYDAIGSQILLQFMLKAGGIAIVDGKFSLGPNWVESVESYAREVGGLEAEVAKMQPKQGRRAFQDFAKLWGGFYSDSEARVDELNPFFMKCAEGIAA